MIITGTGLTTSVGHGFRAGCAAIRAGIKRPVELKHYLVGGETYFDENYLTGYPIQNHTDGFSPLARWIIMSREALQDFERQTKSPLANSLLPEETKFIFVTPYLESPRFTFSGIINNDSLKDEYCIPLLKGLGIQCSKTDIHTIQEDHRGTISAVEKASELFDDKSVKKVIVIAADSCIDIFSLQWYAEKNRLKTDANPAGFIPGEAAAVILLEPDERTGDMDVGVAKIVCLATDNHNDEVINEDTERGPGLIKTITSVLENYNHELPFSGMVYTDLNGENWRAREFGIARSAISEAQWLDTGLIIPARSLGDTGAASGVIAICMMIHTRLKNYAVDKHCLLLSSDEKGLTGSMIIEV